MAKEVKQVNNTVGSREVKVLREDGTLMLTVCGESTAGGVLRKVESYHGQGFLTDAQGTDVGGNALVADHQTLTWRPNAKRVKVVDKDGAVLLEMEGYAKMSGVLDRVWAQFGQGQLRDARGRIVGGGTTVAHQDTLTWYPSDAGRHVPEDEGQRALVYSKLLASHLGLRQPWEQYGLYASTGFAVYQAGHHLSRARAVSVAASTRDAVERRQTMELHRLSEVHLERPSEWARRFRLRGASLLAVPALWVAWRAAVNANAPPPRS